MQKTCVSRRWRGSAKTVMGKARGVVRTRKSCVRQAARGEGGLLYGARHRLQRHGCVNVYAMVSPRSSMAGTDRTVKQEHHPPVG